MKTRLREGTWMKRGYVRGETFSCNWTALALLRSPKTTSWMKKAKIRKVNG